MRLNTALPSRPMLLAFQARLSEKSKYTKPLGAWRFQIDAAKSPRRLVTLGFACGLAFVSVLGGSRFRTLGFLGVPGDSGGGWFIDANGELQLASVTSASNATANAHGYGFITAASRLDIDWINTTRTTAVPEPGSFILFAAGASLLALRRRRKRTSQEQASAPQPCQPSTQRRRHAHQAILKTIAMCLIVISAWGIHLDCVCERVVRYRNRPSVVALVGFF